MCSRWKNSFVNFLKDMGERPGKEFSIDRINSKSDYKPGNCRWVLSSIQQNNRSNNIWLQYDTRWYTASQLARLLHITPQSVWKRLKNWGNPIKKQNKHDEDVTK